MKKIAFLLISFILVKYSNSQVTMNVLLPEIGTTLKSQLWNFTLTNVGREMISVKVNMVMTDLGTGQQVLSASTNIIQLPVGVKIFQYSDVVPVSYISLANAYNIDPSPNGFLPIGNFSVCFEVLKQGSEVFETLSEDCSMVRVEPVNPPMLNFPEDKASIEENQPLFTWLPPAPLQLFNNLTYELKLVEIFPNQSIHDAINENFPLLYKQNIMGTNLQFPHSATPLDTGKIYAWQVTALNNNLLVAQTDVWEFNLEKKVADKLVQVPVYYHQLMKGGTSEKFLCNGILNINYFNELNDQSAFLRVYTFDKKKNKRIEVYNETINLKYQQNLISIDMLEKTSLKTNITYTIELTNSNKESWTGMFEYKNN